jgi:DNA helicase-2/ATP-dependent DNA helicase PcrA
VERLDMSLEEQAILDDILRRKGALDMARRLEAFLAKLETECIPKEDIRFLGRPVMTVEQVQRLFLKDLHHFPLAVRRDEIKKLSEKRLDAAVEETRQGLMTLVEKKLDQLLASMPDGEERRSKARALLDARDQRLEELKQRRKEFAAGFNSLFGTLELLPVYEAFLRAEAERDPENLPMLEATLPLLQKKTVAPEDLPALLLLAKGLLGLERMSIRHVMIDEAQDVSPLQVKALRMLFGHDAFTLVGDLCQGIYGREGLASWQDLGNGVFEQTPEVCRLSTSYRSTVEIMETAYHVLEKHPVPGEGAAKPVERHGEKPLLLSVKNDKERLQALAEIVQRWQQEGLSSVAVVVKTAKAAKALHKALQPHLSGLHLMSQADDAFAGGLQVVDSSMVKGLEFDGVIIADADESTYPDQPFYAKLLYVLCTRPLHKLALVSAGKLTSLLD